MIKFISDIGKENSYVQVENHLGYLIGKERLPNLKMCGQVNKTQVMTIGQYHICVSQHYRWHMVIEYEWGGM